MPVARTSTSLHSRIDAARSGPNSLPTHELEIRPPAVSSYTEHYRGTRYDTGYVEQEPPSEPLFSDARLLVMTSAVLTVVAGASLAVFLG